MYFDTSFVLTKNMTALFSHCALLPVDINNLAGDILCD